MPGVPEKTTQSVQLTGLPVVRILDITLVDSPLSLQQSRPHLGHLSPTPAKRRFITFLFHRSPSAH